MDFRVYPEHDLAGKRALRRNSFFLAVVKVIVNRIFECRLKLGYAFAVEPNDCPYT